MTDGGSILIVTAKQEDGQKLAQILASMGFSTDLHSDGGAAWESFLKSPPDLVLFERNLETISGLDLARWIRDDPVGAKTPLALLVGRADDVEQMQEVEVDLVLHRPLKLKELGQELREMISRTRDERSAALAKHGPPIKRRPEPRKRARKPDKADADAGEPAKPAAKRVHLWTPPSPTERKRGGRTAIFSETGRVEDISVPELFADLYLSVFTGRVTFSRANLLKRVIWLDGNVVYVDSHGRDESLGQILVREGVISERDCLLSIANMRTYSTRQGGALIEMGALTPLQLMEALRLQVWEKAISLFSWFEGEYIREKMDVDRGRYTAFALDTPWLVNQGIRRWYQPDTLKAIFDQAKTARFMVNPRAPIEPHTLGLSKAEHDFLTLFDGRHTVDEIIFTSPLDMAMSLQTMYWLIALEVIAPAEEMSREDLDKLDRAAPDKVLDSYFESLGSLAYNLAKELADVSGDKKRAGVSDEVEESPPKQTMEPMPAAEPEWPVDSEYEERPADSRFIAAAEAMQVKPAPARPSQKAAPTQAMDLEKVITGKFLQIEGATHYEVLGVDPKATREHIEDAYGKMVRRFSQDRIGDKATPELIAKAEAIIERADLAYLDLGDPVRRRVYDDGLAEAHAQHQRKMGSILEAENSFRRGVEALKNDEFEVAVASLRRALKLFPQESDYHAFLGWALFNDPRLSEDDQISQGKKCLVRANELNPKSDISCLFLGRMLKARGNQDGAAQMFSQALRRNPRNDEARHELSLIRETAGLPPSERAPSDFKPRPQAEEKSDFTSAKATIKRALSRG